MSNNIQDDYDGFYFLPGQEDSLNITFFKFIEKKFRGKPVDNTKTGDMFHIAFFRENEEGLPEFDDEFEAIFIDPTVYIKELVGMNLYGCVLRKTEKSGKWWKTYLTKAKEECKILATIES